MSISEHEAKILSDYEAKVDALKARVETAERDLDMARGLIARLGDPDSLESLWALLRYERARVAELERVQDAAFRDAHRAEADAARLREALGDVRPLVESLRDGVEDMHWYSARDAMLSALRAIDAALSAYAEVES